MDLLDAIRGRRSVKTFDPEHEMEDRELRQLLELAALTPSSFNMQNWHLVAARRSDTKRALRAAAWDQAQVSDASLVLVIAGKLGAWRHRHRFLRMAPPTVRTVFDGMIPAFYSGREQLDRDEACRSTGLMGMTIMLAARELGFESCPMIGFDPKEVAKILQLPADHPPLLMLTIGRALAPAKPRLGLLDLEEFVSEERFGNHAFHGPVPDPHTSA